ncbi:hypothetical protein ACHWQZ_G002627 [Mnemiopsis leidyi]
MQQIDDLLQGVYDLLMKAYPENSANENGPFPVTDNVLTSSQIIRLRLKAPGLLLMPSDKGTIKRDLEEDLETGDQLAPKKIKISASGNGSTSLTPPLGAEQSAPGPSSASPTVKLPLRDRTPIEEYRLRPQFRKCSKCNVMFGSNELLAVHIATAHRNTQTWNCMAHQTCPMVFQDIRSLKTHVYEIHIKECPVCKCTFEESSLAKHIICTHAELTTCPICSNQYAEQHALMVHVKVQHDLPSYRLRTESTLSVKSETASP